MIILTKELVSHAVVAYIDQKIKVHSSDRFINDAFCLACAETRYFGIKQISVTLISGKCQGVFVFVLALRTPGNQVFVYLSSQIGAAFEGDDSQ